VLEHAETIVSAKPAARCGSACWISARCASSSDEDPLATCCARRSRRAWNSGSTRMRSENARRRPRCSRWISTRKRPTAAAISSIVVRLPARRVERESAVAIALGEEALVQRTSSASLSGKRL
jgi:hypothetical protein